MAPNLTPRQRPPTRPSTCTEAAHALQHLDFAFGQPSEPWLMCYIFRMIKLLCPSSDSRGTKWPGLGREGEEFITSGSWRGTHNSLSRGAADQPRDSRPVERACLQPVAVSLLEVGLG